MAEENKEKANDKPKKPKPLETTFHILPDGRIAEEIFREGKEMFVLFDQKDNSFSYVSSFNINDKKYVPRRIDEAEHASLSLADGVEPYNTLSELRQEVIDLCLKQFDPMGNTHLYELVLNLGVSSWVLEDWQKNMAEKYAPILIALGASETGKKRYLTTMRSVFYRSQYALKTTKIPSLFRTIEPWQGTLILDEADTDASLHGEFIEFLNSRTDGVPIQRYSPKTDKCKFFKSFGHTILALRKPLNDDGTMSRSIVFQTTSTDNPKKYDLLASEEWTKKAALLRRKLLYFRLTHLGKGRIPSQFEVPDVFLFRSRASMLMLKALSDEDPRIMDNVEVVAREIQRRTIEERAASPEGQILNILYEAILDDSCGISTTKIGGKDGYYLEIEVDPIKPGDAPTTQPIHVSYVYEQLGKAISLNMIGRHLRGHGLTTKQMRIDTKSVRGIIIIKNPKNFVEDTRKYVVDAEWEEIKKIFEKERIL